MIDPHLLESFLTLAETRNFTSAAHKLLRSQSALSLQIKKLEQTLGKTLFVRDNRAVSLTLEGEQLIPFAKQILQLESEMLHFFQQPQPAGEVIFGIPEDLATTYLPALLSTFSEKYPKIFIEVHCELTLNLIEKFQRGTFHLIIIKQDPNAPLPRSIKLGDETLVWVGNGTASYKLEDTSTCIPLILAPAPCVYRERAINTLNAHGIRWKISYSSPSLAGALAAARAGLGVSVIPSEMVPKNLKILHQFPKLKPCEISLLKSEAISGAVQTFASFVENYFIRR